MSTIDPRLCFPPDGARLHQWRQCGARERPRTADETEEGRRTTAAELSPSPGPVFTAGEDCAMRRQLLEQDAAGDWLATAAQEAEAAMPSSPPPPPTPHPVIPEAEKAAGTSAGGIRLQIGGFAPLAPADDWRSLVVPTWQGPPPQKAAETGWYPYVVPGSANLFVGARQRLPDEVEAVLPSSAVPSPAPKEQQDPAPVVRRRPPPPVVVCEIPAPPPLLLGRMKVGCPAPGIPPRERYVPRAPPAIQPPLSYLPVGHHGPPVSPLYLTPARPPLGYRLPTWYAKAPGAWWDPRMPGPVRGWTGPPRFGHEQARRACFWDREK